MQPVTEKVVVLGAAKALVGIASRPAGPALESRPAIIVLNTGVVHRVGHHRMFVTFARELAAEGYLVLRFDLSGLGDSGDREESVDLLTGALEDIRQAVDWSIGQGAAGVILTGLCSGADHSIIYGSHDPRVVGVVLLDPSIPPTSRFVRITLQRRLIRRLAPGKVFGRLIRLLAPDKALGRLRRAWRRLTTARPPIDPAAESWERPSIQIHRQEVRDFMEDAYRRTVGLGAQIFALFTSDFEHQHNYRTQILDAFPSIKFGDQLHLDYLKGVDHTFTVETHRRMLFDRMRGWILQRFPGVAVPADAARSAGP